jgi:hypothetical protein
MEVKLKSKDLVFNIRISRNYRIHEIFWLIFDWIGIHPNFLPIKESCDRINYVELNPEDFICDEKRYFKHLIVT